MYLLDTDSCIFLLNQKNAAVEERLKNLGRDEVGISAITMAELYYGAAHSKKRGPNEARLKIFCSSLSFFPFDKSAAELFGDLKERLISRGEMIGMMDLLIGCVALSQNAVLVTHNSREFKRIPKLKVEDWFE